MIHHPIIVGCLLGSAVVLTVLCAVGLLVSRNPYQRLQFCTPVTSLAGPLIAAAVWVGETDVQARIKATLVAVVLLSMNGVLGHATGRAIKIRQAGGWPPPDRKNGGDR